MDNSYPALRDETIIVDKDSNVFDSFSDLNINSISLDQKKNTSFMSLNDESCTGPDFHKSRSEKKIDVASIKLLPQFIEKVSQNIESIMTKADNMNETYPHLGKKAASAS